MVRWPLQPLQPFQKTQLQPPVGPSVHSLRHPWFTTNNLSYRFPIFETPAAALCGTTGKYPPNITQHLRVYIYICVCVCVRVYIIHTQYTSRRKFRSQISDNMDRWKAEMGRVQRREEKKKEDQKEKVSQERRSRCAEKVGKLRNCETLCFSNDLWPRRVEK